MPPQQRRRRIRSRLGRALTLGTATVIVLAGMTACSSPSPIDATEDCTDVGSQPTSELGSAEILLSSSGYLLYADGWLVVSADEGPDAAHAMQVPMMAPPDPAGSRWQPAYLGSCQLEAVDTLAARHPDQAGLIAAYRDRWPEMIAGPFEETVRVLADLRAAGVALYALTNWSAETFPVAQRRFDFLRWFEGTVVSGQEQLVKPDPRLYRLLAQRHGLDLRHSVFIDDTPANVVAARELGMLGLDFVNAERLRADLTAHGLLASGTAAQADRA